MQSGCGDGSTSGITAKNGVTLKTGLDLTTAPLKAGKNQVAVYIIDNNPAVADPDFRSKHMPKSTMWWVWGG